MKNGLKTINIIISSVLVLCVVLALTTLHTNSKDRASIVESYRKSTQDFTKQSLSITQKSIEAKASESTAAASNVNVPGTSSDLMSLTKSVLTHFTYNGAFFYSQSANTSWDASSITETCNNKTLTANKSSGGFNDCSTYVSLLLYFTGRQGSNYVHMNSATLAYYGSPVIANTFSQVQVGDVFVKTGHVAIVVAKDDTYIYFGDAGSTKAITSSAQNGYYQKFLLTANTSEWRKGKYSIRR